MVQIGTKKIRYNGEDVEAPVYELSDFSNSSDSFFRTQINGQKGAVPFFPITESPDHNFLRTYHNNTKKGLHTSYDIHHGIIDSFEDADISEYSGDTSSTSITTNTVKEGSNALKLNEGQNKITSASDLPRYPKQGDIFEFHHNFPNGAVPRFYFGAQNTSNYYYVELDDPTGTLALYKVSSGSATKLGSASLTFENNTWVRTEIEWRTNGKMLITHYDSTDTEIATLEVTDTTYTSGGVGWGEWSTTGKIWELASDWDSAQSESGVVHESVSNTDHNDGAVVKQGYSVADPYLSADLVGYWPLQEDSGGTAYDFSGNSNNGTVNGATQGATGLLGTSAYSFDGTDDYITMSNPTPTAFTISIWAYWDGALNPFEAPMSTRVSSNGWMLRLDTDNATQFYVYDSSASTYQVVNGTLPNTGEWTHFVGTCDSNGNTELFIDTVSQGTNSVGSRTQSGELRIGDGPGRDRYWNGDLADARIYNRALTSTEIQTLYDVVDKDWSLTTDVR